MKRIYVIFSICVLLTNWVEGQQCNATGSSIDTTIQVTKNIKTDFGAVGDGVTDDHDAFKAAATFINGNSGNVRLIIPDGIYIVGKQTSNLGSASNAHPVYEGEDVMLLTNVSNVSILGSTFSSIIFRDSMHFGTFDISTGLIPSPIDLYNPLAPSSSNPSFEYKYAGIIGNFLLLNNCSNMEIKNLEINGNSDRYKLGGTWGIGSRPIELSNCYGVFLLNVSNSSFQNLKIHHFGVDNLYLASTFTGGDTSLAVSNNNIFDSLYCEYAGRNNFSWVGGKNICVLNSSFNHAAIKDIITSPGIGMDIEPEGVTGEVLCSDGFFLNNVYAENASLGITPGTSLDNPVSAVGFGYSYNHYFKKCTVVGKYAAAVYNYINRVVFDSCSFYGQVLNYGSSTDPGIEPAVYRYCKFSDCYNGERMVDLPLLSIEYGYKMQLLNAVFDKYFSSGLDSWLYFYGTTAYACSTETYKPAFENSTFNFYEPADATLKYLAIGRNTKFENNNFYKDLSNNLRWSNPEGCAPGVGTGVTDLGNGLQYHTWPGNYVYPECSDQVVCQENLYLSLPQTTEHYYKTRNFIYADAEITLSTGNIVYQAETMIQLNPGFDTDISGSGNVELKIEGCTDGPETFARNPYSSYVYEEGLSDKSAGKLVAFPNPSGGQYTLVVDNGHAFNNARNIVVRDLLGKLILKQTISATDTRVVITLPAHAKAGAYILTVFNEKSVLSKKIIKL